MAVISSVASAARRTALFEKLDPRVLLTAALGTGDDAGTLFIDGTAGRDSLSVRFASNDRLQVRLNGSLQTFKASHVSQISVQTFDGNDVVDLISVSIPAYVNGGAGSDYVQGGLVNDSLTGAAGKDTLLGGPGDDLLRGGNSNDIIRGQADRDRLFGGAGDDLLFGGSGTDVYDGGDGEDDAQIQDDDVIPMTDIETSALADADDAAVGAGTGSTPSIVTKLPRGISFNDEALFDANYNTSVTQSKALGVNAVRLWLALNTWDDRPQAYDVVTPTDVVTTWKGTRKNIAGMTMKRAFDLKKAGFTVLMTVSVKGGAAPTSTTQVTNLYKHLMNAPLAKGSTSLLKSAVDYWEVGNEVDLAAFWQPSGANKAAGLASYVDKLLIPAATVLHTGTSTTWENVVSSSVSWNPADLYTIVNTLKSRGKLGLIDAIGYHPYGRYDPTNSTIPNEIAANTAKAVNYSKQFGKPLVATEWNVRGYPTNGTRNATWAKAIDYVYRNTILPNYALNFYFALVNNFAARGGNTTARPAGLLKHNTTTTVTPTSSVSAQVAWYQTPLVKSDPFYATYMAW